MSLIFLGKLFGIIATAVIVAIIGHKIDKATGMAKRLEGAGQIEMALHCIPYVITGGIVAMFFK